MAQEMAEITRTLRRVLAELDKQKLHLPAIHVARALEVVQLVAEERAFKRQSRSVDENIEI
jgi:hypothetical protein